MKPVKHQSALTATSIVLGILTMLKNREHWHSALDEYMVGQIVSIGFAIVTSYFLLRLIWPKK